MSASITFGCTVASALALKGRYDTFPTDSAGQGTFTIQRGANLLTGSWVHGLDLTKSRWGIGLAADNRIWFARTAKSVGRLGIVRYTLEDGNLRPIWSATEVKTPVNWLGYGIGTRVSGSRDDFFGVFDIAYTNDDGSLTNVFQLTIEDRGAVVLLTWKQADSVKYQGIGLVRGDALGAAWTPVGTGEVPVEIAVFPDFLAAKATASQGEWAMLGDERTRPDLIHGLAIDPA